MSTPGEPLDLPDRRLFWRWVGDAVRPVLGWVLVALGALALILGWFGVSGQALTSKQLPYLVSGGLTGIALVVVAAVVLATDDFRREMGRLDALERKVDDLYGLFAAELAPPATAAEAQPVSPNGAVRVAAPAVPAASVPAARAAVNGRPAGGSPMDAGEPVVALPNGTSYHRPSCPLTAGKADAVAVDPGAIRDRGLRPCRVCDPDPVTAGAGR